MDLALTRLNDIKEFLQKCLFFGNAKNITEYANLTREVVVGKKTKKIWTDAFRIALKENKHLYIPSGEYYIDDTIVIPSNRKITADKKAKVCLLDGIKVIMFCNENVLDGTSKFITLDEPHAENIEIDGGIWATEYDFRAKYGQIGAYDVNDSMHGVYALMLFSGVKNLCIKNAVFQNTPAFAVQIGRAENFLVENVDFVNCYADGVHLNGMIKNGMVFNVKGHTEDDLVALNAYDWDNSTINNGPMEDITVSRVYSTGGNCHCMRVQGGVTSEEKGNINCSIKNMHISHITGVQTFKLYLQTPSYVGEPEGTKVGSIDNITFEDIEIDKQKPSDEGLNYYEKDLVTGHFGIFEINSNISKITFKNINFKINTIDYPDTAHFITVGPKSRYIPEINLEVFDPYASSIVKEIVCENITMGGEQIKNIRDCIKEITFDKLYNSEYSSGSGKVKKITQL